MSRTRPSKPADADVAADLLAAARIIVGGTEAMAAAWLDCPSPDLGGARPVDLLLPLLLLARTDLPPQPH